MALCFDVSESKVLETVESIHARMKKTEYTCAVGVGFRYKEDSFEAVCRTADAAMYEDKKMLKRQQGLLPEVR